MYRVLYESYVKHCNFLWWKPVKKDYVEGLQNRAWGTIKNNEFTVEFTNSFGKSGASLVGKFKCFLNLCFATGKAYGYENYPDGRPCIAFGFFGCRYLHLIVPGYDSRYLYIRMAYKELPND